MILRADEIARYYPGYSDTEEGQALEHAAEAVVCQLANREFIAVALTEYGDTVGRRFYVARPPIAASPAPIVTVTADGSVLTVDTGIGKQNEDYAVLVSCFQLHADYHDGEDSALKVEYTGGYAEGSAPESVKKAVGLAMQVLNLLGFSAGMSAVNFTGENYTKAADPWAEVKALIAPYRVYAV